MTDKKYITGADVLRALADGKKVRPCGNHFVTHTLENNSTPGHSLTYFLSNNFEIVEEPATDAALIAEMRALANDPAIPRGEQGVYLVCADMLEKRKVKP